VQYGSNHDASVLIRACLTSHRVRAHAHAEVSSNPARPASPAGLTITVSDRSHPEYLAVHGLPEAGVTFVLRASLLPGAYVIFSVREVISDVSSPWHYSSFACRCADDRLLFRRWSSVGAD